MSQIRANSSSRHSATYRSVGKEPLNGGAETGASRARYSTSTRPEDAARRTECTRPAIPPLSVTEISDSESSTASAAAGFSDWGEGAVAGGACCTAPRIVHPAASATIVKKDARRVLARLFVPDLTAVMARRVSYHRPRLFRSRSPLHWESSRSPLRSSGG